jgi:hypothetical protein
LTGGATGCPRQIAHIGFLFSGLVVSTYLSFPEPHPIRLLPRSESNFDPAIRCDCQAGSCSIAFA